MECCGKMSSFYLDGVVSGSEPLGSYSLSVRVAHVSVSDALVYVMTEFRPEKCVDENGVED